MLCEDSASAKGPRLQQSSIWLSQSRMYRDALSRRPNGLGKRPMSEQSGACQVVMGQKWKFDGGDDCDFVEQFEEAQNDKSISVVSSCISSGRRNVNL